MDPQDKDTLALVAHHLPVALHHHHAVQLVVSLDRPYRAVLDGQRRENVQGFLVDANVPHACQSTASTVLVVSIDANTVKGKALRHRLAGRTFSLLEEVVAEEAIHRFRSAYWRHEAEADAPFDFLALVSLLSDASSPVPAPDARVTAAMHFMACNIERTLRLREVAAAVALSESRLRHLFVRDVGIPVTTYILWSRMKVALNALMTQGVNLADAAHHAGYADQAHFTRTFRRMFGVSPSLLLKHSRCLQVFGAS